jgi:Phage terminase large subunit (GpA)
MAENYAARKERERARQSEQATTGRDIGPIPKVANARRRKKCERNLELYLKTYFPQTFPLPFCSDHRKVIARIQTSVLHGGLYALAMPRGSGKTSICECSCLWGTSYGHTEFVALIGADADKAKLSLDSIKRELEVNELLQDDFPEVCYPIEKLERIANRVKGQLCEGEPTYIVWTDKLIVLPTIRRSKAAGAVIKSTGLTGSIRGMKYKRADGHAARPTLVIIDDCQTDASASSLGQCVARERILSGAVLGLAGPGKKIAGVMPCTVIRPGDVADNILSRDKHPEWHGERTKLVYSFPKNEKLWDQYRELRAEGLRSGDEGKAATEFYRSNRVAMDEGAALAWPERFNHDELSACQNAMNLLFQDEEAFHAEYQNEPKIKKQEDAEALTADQIAGKLNSRRRGEVPLGCSHVTCFVDVQQSALFWTVAAWQTDFTGFIIDYGIWPEQARSYITLSDIRKTLLVATKAAGLQEAIYAGLEALGVELAAREWRREDGTPLRIGKFMIDANWAESTAVVNQWCRQSPHAAILQPSHGRFVGAGGIPFDQYPKRDGEHRGHNWILKPPEGRRGASVRRLLFDSNYWKSFVHSRLAVGMGGKGCLSLFGTKPSEHRLFADHLTAEYRVRTEGRGRVVYEWKERPERRDNHWLDCIVGCAVGASMLGCSLEVHGDGTQRKRQRISLDEMRARAQGKRIGEK